MDLKNKLTNYWFTIEPYVFVGLTDRQALLYNTLDGTVLESCNMEVIKLLHETLQRENSGVVLLTNDRYKQQDIIVFIDIIRKNFMGDIVDVSLSKGKPIQLLPYYNYLDKRIKVRDVYFSENRNMLENLSEISIYLDSKTDGKQLIPILQSVPKISVINIHGSIRDIKNNNDLLLFLEQHRSDKYIFCSYLDIIRFDQFTKDSPFSYKISVQFPLDMKCWERTSLILRNQPLSFEYIFDVFSEEQCLQVESLVEDQQIDNFQLSPIYNGDNICFFKNNIFVSKEDILTASSTLKDFYMRQMLNTYDFGKISIMPNGDTFANINHTKLGNIYEQSIYEIVQKEIEEGHSWFRIRDQEPCKTCIYQWLCPSPSKYEIIIGRPNLCHIEYN